jgi:hypothetical protein
MSVAIYSSSKKSPVGRRRYSKPMAIAGFVVLWSTDGFWFTGVSPVIVLLAGPGLFHVSALPHCLRSVADR